MRKAQMANFTPYIEASGATAFDLGVSGHSYIVPPEFFAPGTIPNSRANFGQILDICTYIL